MSKTQPKNPSPSTDPPAEVAEIVEATVVDAVDDDTAKAVAVARNYIEAKNLGPRTIEIITWIAAHALDTADINNVILEQLSERLLAAKSPAEILMPFAPQTGRQFLDKPLRIHEAEYLESGFTETFPYYVSLVISVPPDKETTVITIGGERLVMQVAAADAGNHLPMYCMMRLAPKPTKAGFYPLELVPATG